MRNGSDTEVRPELVLTLRGRLERGEYVVDASQVAASILRRLAAARRRLRPAQADD